MLFAAESVKKIEKKDEFDPNAYYVSLTSHAEQFGVDPVRIRVRFMIPAFIYFFQLTRADRFALLISMCVLARALAVGTERA